MNKILEFGRKALFYVRVLSGYEERKIRAYRLQLHKEIEQAQARKAEARLISEKIVLSEVRHMVEEMQKLNRTMEETEAAVEQYFKPLDKEVEKIMKMQLKGEEGNMKEMIKIMDKEASIENKLAPRVHIVVGVDEDKASSTSTNNQV